MTESTALGYAFELSLPPDLDDTMRAWAETTPGASWDAAGGHVTLAHLRGSLLPEAVLPGVRLALAGAPAFDVTLSAVVRAPYWGKPGLEIVMLAAAADEDVSEALAIRDKLLGELLADGLTLREGEDYRPHVTLTTGLPPAGAVELEEAARGMILHFTAYEVVFWYGAERPDEHGNFNPPWRIIDRMLLI